MEIRPAGPHGLLVEVEDSAAARGLAEHVRASGLEVDDLVPAARTLLLAGVADPARAVDVVRAFDGSREAGGGPLVEVPVVYDGPDLAFVADARGWSVEELVRRHVATEFTCEFAGFAPGFGYLSGWDLAVPRLDTPRPRVAAGSVALADRWCGVYPSASPGGWRIIGTTRLGLWDASREPPALVGPGVRVRFTEVTR